ncbi:unnamed protein product, partial [Brassica napus]
KESSISRYPLRRKKRRRRRRVLFTSVSGEHSSGTGSFRFVISTSTRRRLSYKKNPKYPISLFCQNPPFNLRKLNLDVSDKPMPRGEIVVGDNCVTAGYFNNQAKTDEVYKELLCNSCCSIIRSIREMGQSKQELNTATSLSYARTVMQ